MKKIFTNLLFIVLIVILGASVFVNVYYDSSSNPQVANHYIVTNITEKDSLSVYTMQDFRKITFFSFLDSKDKYKKGDTLMITSK